MLNKNMSLQERLRKDIESAWQGIAYDGELTIAYSTDKTEENEDVNFTIYEAGPQRQIAFSADSCPQKFSTEVQNVLTSIKKKFPNCTKYNFSIEEIEGGMQRKILLTLE